MTLRRLPHQHPGAPPPPRSGAPGRARLQCRCQEPGRLGCACVGIHVERPVPARAIQWQQGVPAYVNDGTDAANTFDRRAGDHHDGIQYFGLSANGTYSATSSDRGLLVQNHEAITPVFLHPTGQTIVAGARTVADEVLREFYVHGVSVIEVTRAAGAWSYNQSSTFNRRVHTLTPIELSGPARGSAQMITKYSTDGTRTRGTINNCAHGYTPWYTYLACEENWAGYFRRVTATDNPNRTAKELTSFSALRRGRQRPRTVGDRDAGYRR